MALAARFTSSGLTFRPLRSSRCRTTALRVQAHLDPYRTLGIDVLADEACIKKAFRKLALQLHPDVCKTDDAEKRFVEVAAAYELLIGKARGKEIQEPGESSWDWHDWYWQFRAQRTADKQRSAKAAAEGYAGGGASTQTRFDNNKKVEMGSQLAGLRERSAIRNTRKLRREQQEQVHQAAETSSCSDSQPAADAAGSLSQARTSQPAAAEPVVELHRDAAEGTCDSAELELVLCVKQSAGEAPPPPPPPPGYHRKFAGTSDTRSFVANQIVGLRRKKAFHTMKQQQQEQHAV